MGFRASEAGTVWALNFEQYPGLMVRVRRPGFAAQVLIDRARDLPSSADKRQKIAAARNLVIALADSILSWTLEDERGRTLPVSRRNVLAQDDALLRTIYAAWNREVLQPIQRAAAGQAEPDIDDQAAQLAAERQLRDVPMEALPGEQSGDEQAEDVPGAVSDVG